MRVIRAKVLGACFGVKRAIAMVEDLVRSGQTEVYTLGPLIHNATETERLEKLGVKALPSDTDPRSCAGKTAVIRAHGLPPDAEAALRERAKSVLDATCPRVKSSQLLAARQGDRGDSRRVGSSQGDRRGGSLADSYTLFIAGEASHAEVTGIRGYAEKAGCPRCIVVANATEAALFSVQKAAEIAQKAAEAAQKSSRKAALLAQTTFSEPEYKAVQESLRRVYPELEVFDTICGASKERQDALRNLCAEVDFCVIAGSPASANSCRLRDIALSCGKPAFLVENASPLPPEIAALKKRTLTCGLSAGASTPEAVIDEIEAVLTGP